MKTIPRNIQSQVEPDEQVLWWKRPRVHLSVRRMLFDSIFMLIVFGLLLIVFGLLLWLAINTGLSSSSSFDWVVFGLIFLGIVAFASFLSMSLRTSHTFLYQSPPHCKHTSYAITSKRVLIVVHVRRRKPIVFDYHPSEIDGLSSRKLTDGVYTLTFAASRQARIGDMGDFFTLPGSFYGIHEVKKVSALLEQLRMQRTQVMPGPV
jgi:hypothetical protein